MDHLPRRLVRIAIALTVTLAGGTAGFMLIEHYSLFDAFYMTLTTVTTVGNGEIRPLSHVGRIFNSFLIFFGVIVMLLAIGAMTQTIIELELNQFFGKRRVKKMIEKLAWPLHRLRLRPRGPRRGGRVADARRDVRGGGQQRRKS